MMQEKKERPASAGSARLILVRFKRRNSQFVLPSAVGTAQQYEILKHIHLTKRKRSMMRRHTGFEELLARRLVS